MCFMYHFDTMDERISCLFLGTTVGLGGVDRIGVRRPDAVPLADPLVIICPIYVIGDATSASLMRLVFGVCIAAEDGTFPETNFRGEIRAL